MGGFRGRFVPIVVAITAGLAIGGYVSGSDTASSGSPAVWVSTLGNDNTCARNNQSLPCLTFDRAFAIASSGDIIEVAGGTYTTQTINEVKSSTVTLQAATGADVNVNTSLIVDPPAANLTIKNVDVPFVRVGGTCSGTSTTCGTRATNITLDDVDVDSFAISYVNGVTFQNGDVGPDNSCSGYGHPLVGHNHSTVTNWAPQNVTISGNAFHDIITSGCTDPHTECLLVWSGDGVTISKNSFVNCQSTGPIYITKLNLTQTNINTIPCQDIVFENNMVVGNTGASFNYAHFESDCEILVRYNSFGGSSPEARPYFLPASSVPAGNTNQAVTVYGNYSGPPVMQTGTCTTTTDAFTFTYNAFRGVSCGGTNTNVGTLDYVSSTDLHLSSGSASAVDLGDPVNYPSTDIDGDARPQGSAPDAGADEKA